MLSGLGAKISSWENVSCRMRGKEGKKWVRWGVPIFRGQTEEEEAVKETKTLVSEGKMAQEKVK